MRVYVHGDVYKHEYFFTESLQAKAKLFFWLVVVVVIVVVAVGAAKQVSCDGWSSSSGRSGGRGSRAAGREFGAAAVRTPKTSVS